MEARVPALFQAQALVAQVVPDKDQEKIKKIRRYMKIIWNKNLVTFWKKMSKVI